MIPIICIVEANACAKCQKELHMSKQYYVYILASKRNGTLYIGVTNNLERRDCEHESDINQGFTSRYGVYILVYYEVFSDVNDAIRREKH